MTHIKYLICVALLAAIAVTAFNKPYAVELKPSTKKDVATCTGSSPCRACSSCGYCRWCNSGGTCGICAPAKKLTPSRSYKTPIYSGQCKAITKKGTRCSRNARSKGYCWQHGG